METRTVEQVETWNSRPFTDGYAGLRELSDGEFSGAVRAGGAWLFMLNGRVIGVFEGSLDDFEDADGTAYAAPHPSLPLLFSMQEQGGETQAKYYTNDTPLSEVDSTLSSGKFTGFVELSENVLSGDYYVAYYGGRSMSVAFVGASEQVVTGDEAFDRAKDEVGIYEVRDVDVEVTDVPEPEGADESPDAGAGGASDSGGSDAAGNAPGTSAGASDAGAERSDASAGASGSSASASDASTSDGNAGAGTTDAGTPDEPAGTDAASAREDPSAGQSPTTATASEATTTSEADPASETTQTSESASPSSASESTPDRPSSERATGDDSGATPDRETTASAGESSATTQVSETTDAERTTDASSSSGVESPAPSPAEESTSSADAAIEEAEPEATADSDASSGPDAATEASADAESDAFREEAEWRETTTIPSLDPDRSDGPHDERESAGAGAAGADRRAKSDSPSRSSKASRSSKRAAKRRQSGGQSSGASGAGSSGAAAGSSDAASGASSAGSGASAGSPSKGASGSASEGTDGNAATGDSDGGPDPEEVRARIEKLRSQLGQRKQQVETLKERLSSVESERDEFKRERDALAQEVERLEARLERAESGGSDGSGPGLSEAEAFDGTNLFVRYQSKGKATLDEAAEGKVDADDVNANLRLEHHTQFETEGATVAGEPFESFLADSFEYQFVSWIIEELLYEIRETGHRNSLRDLYEAIPKIDRVDLHGTVSAGGEESDTRQESFDVIMRDRMGNPLVVADLNGTRDPTTGEMMGSLVDAASGVGEAYDELAGAFQVTESFFEPEALETTETATSGGFLSREKRESFVKLSRKRGYHLCLVESRSGGFHLNVPEL